MERITIDPVTRLEGHGKIEIFLNDEGNVENAYFQVPELRGFEKFCQDRPIEEVPRIVPRICGVCPEAHHMAATKALDGVFSVEPPAAGHKLRELFYVAHIIHSHIAHFYALAAPDFVVGPDADPEDRNILGVIAKVGVDTGEEVIKHRSYAQKIQAMLGGKATHPVCGLPGGMSKSLTEEERQEVEEMAKSLVEFSELSLGIFEDVVLDNEDYLELIKEDFYAHETNYMGMIDENGHVNFYDGQLRVVSPTGEQVVEFDADDYLDYVEERVEEWTYIKFPYLKDIGWKGFVDGADSGIYRVGPLARLNVAEGMATPKAQEAYENMYSALGGGPIHATLANHWARLIELIYASERLLELSQDDEITSEDIRNIPTETPDEGVGVVEAPRGTLFHHYKANEEGMTEKVNLIVATTNNHAPICMSIKKAAQGLITNGEVNDGLLNMVEMAFRAYDPCLSCATHSLPGQMPMQINIHDEDGEVIKRMEK
jgi:F420-non-reducing hydrogenase large subunit